MAHEQLLQQLLSKSENIFPYELGGDKALGLNGVVALIARDVVDLLPQDVDLSLLGENIADEFVKYLLKPQIKKAIFQIASEESEEVYRSSYLRTLYVKRFIVPNLQKKIRDAQFETSLSIIPSSPVPSVSKSGDLQIELPSPVSMESEGYKAKPPHLKHQMYDKARIKDEYMEALESRNYPILPTILYKILPDLSVEEKSVLIAEALSSMVNHDIQRLKLDESFLKLVSLSEDSVLKKISKDYISVSNANADMGIDLEQRLLIADQFVTRLEMWAQYVRTKDNIIKNVEPFNDSLSAMIEVLSRVGYNRDQIQSELENLSVELMLSATYISETDRNKLEDIAEVAGFTEDKKSSLAQCAIIRAMQANNHKLIPQILDLLRDKKLKQNIIDTVVYADPTVTNDEKISQLSTAFEVSRKKMRLQDFVRRSKDVVDEVRATLRQNAEQMPTKIPKPKLKAEVAHTTAVTPVKPEVQQQAKQLVANIKKANTGRPNAAGGPVAAPVVRSTKATSTKPGAKRPQSKPIWH